MLLVCKQKTEYEIVVWRVGSEMWIRERIKKIVRIRWKVWWWFFFFKAEAGFGVAQGFVGLEVVLRDSF